MARVTAADVRGLAPRAGRYSLRARVFLAVTAAALAPQALVFAWSQLERTVPSRMWSIARDAVNEATQLVAASDGPEREKLAALARAERVRLRVVDPSGQVVFDEDADDAKDALHAIEKFFFHAASATELRKTDEDLGPIGQRAEVQFAREGGLYVDCQWDRVLVCTGVRRASDTKDRAYVVHVQKSSLRAVTAVYALRSNLMRLGLVTVPLALVLALYAAVRVMRPIEELRRQALAKAGDATSGAPRAALSAHQGEVGDLAAAFNALLATLHAKRTENEAFVAELVQELKSPVAAVRATAESLAEAPPDPARAARLARILSESAGKLDHLVTHFLELARAEAGMPNEERAEVDLGELAEALATRANEDERHAALDVDFAREGAERLVVLGVPHRLAGLVRELYENGASFARCGVRVRVRADGDGAVLEVTDDGPGITAEDLPRVFRRFFTTRARGTGLGLALVRAVAEAHGGDVTARSVVGEGATFTLRLPRVT